MDVILLEKIHRLGNLGDQVRVKAGYGRNFLIPSGKAVPATPVNVEKFEERRVELEKVQAEAVEKAKTRADKLNEVSVTLIRKAGGEGKLFGSVGTIDIAEAVSERGVELDKHEIRLPQGPFRTIGSFEVDVHLHADVGAKIKINIVPEQEKEKAE